MDKSLKVADDTGISDKTLGQYTDATNLWGCNILEVASPRRFAMWWSIASADIGNSGVYGFMMIMKVPFICIWVPFWLALQSQAQV